MYNFHYNYIKKKYGNNAKLLLTDTDLIIYNITTEDRYKEFWADKDKFNFSKYNRNKNLSYYDPKNKKVIGKMKPKAY